MKYTIFKTLHSQQGQRQQDDWQNFCKLIKQAPAHSSKTSQPLIKLGAFKNDSRAGDSPLQAITGIELDYDSGLITPEKAAAILNNAGVQSIICSTYTSTSAHPKWRVFLPLSKPYKAKYRAALVHSMDEVLGFIAASESYRDKQLMFFGHNPEQPYTVIETNGKPLDTLSTIRQSAQAYFKQQQQITQKATVKPKRIERLVSGQISVIDSFNETYDIGAILENNAYQFKAGRYIAPSSTSGIAGVNILNDVNKRERAYSHHDNDTLNNGLANDAFDCFTLLEHNGDMISALKAAGNLLFHSDKTLTEHNRLAYQAEQAKQTLQDIQPDNLKIIGKAARALRSLPGGFAIWQEWAGKRGTAQLWQHLAKQKPIKAGHLHHMVKEVAQ